MSFGGLEGINRGLDDEFWGLAVDSKKLDGKGDWQAVDSKGKIVGTFIAQSGALQKIKFPFRTRTFFY